MDDFRQELKPLLAMGIGAAWAAHPFVLAMLLGSLRPRGNCRGAEDSGKRPLDQTLSRSIPNRKNMNNKWLSHAWERTNKTGWWFRTCFIFPYIGNVILPIDFHIFRGVGSTTNQKTNKQTIYIKPSQLQPDRILGSGRECHFSSWHIRESYRPFDG